MLRQPILLVEDNEDEVALTLRAIRKNRIKSEVVVAQNGRAALEYLFGVASAAASTSMPPLLPWIVLLDLKMPGLNGHETLARLRADARTRLVPVIVMSCSSSEEDVQQSYGLGANSFIRKPVNFQEFSTIMQTLHQYWLFNETSTPSGR